ncbi:AP2 domain-containing protein [Corynebacterium terpenotabidum]|uniref:AP2 domain-containing protein n=1 Tax=Corynebacterium terpenotabidum TaxID=89154 RepID=UPI0005A1A58B|nr:AP2 domain-containing protein [Corynebacterium terpenotabidum]
MSVQRRPKTGQPSKGVPVKWIVRYRDPSDKEHSQTFSAADHDKPQEAAKDYDAAIREPLHRGTWIDPADHQITVRELCEQWRDQAVHGGTVKDRQFLIDNLGTLAD